MCTWVIALFGHTVTGFGFCPIGRRDRVLELDLRCWPCRLHGSRACPLGHHGCFADLSWQVVRDATLERIAGSDSLHTDGATAIQKGIL